MQSWRSRSGWRRRLGDAPSAVPLGSGRVASLGAGPKAALLDRACCAGLPVPAGFVLPDGASEAQAGAAALLVGGSSFAVRSAFTAEDGTTSSLAGWFATRLRVEPADVPDAVRDVRRSAVGRSSVGRRDVLVMAMVEAGHAGVAFSEPGYYDDLVNVAEGTAEHLVAGEEAGERVLLPRLERADRGWPRRLQRLLSRVRAVFGDEPWDVEWADDGRTCWLVQLRAVTRPSRRDEALTIANHAEILPPLPSRLMTSIIAEAGPELFAWYRRFDPSLPADRVFLEVVAGRPFINLSLLEDLLRHLGLPTRLVADSIGGPPEHPRSARPLRMARKGPVLARMGLAQVAAVARAHRNEERVAAAGRPAAATFTDALDGLRAAYVSLVTGMFPLSSAIGPPLAVLRRTGTLAEHAARHRTVTAELAEAVDAAHREPPGGPAWQRLLDRFGHRGVYESDVARPRYRDDPSLLLAPGAPVRAPVPVPQRTWRGWITAPVWALARPPLAARERLRDAAMRGFADLRDALVWLAESAVADGRLPAAGHLWLLDATEARRLDSGWRPSEQFWSERRAEQQSLSELDPPPVVHRFDDPAEWTHDPVPAGDRLHGLSLTDGVVRGRAWVLREPVSSLPDGFDPAHTVLVARAVDAGWIPTFALAAAVVVETGGDLSHGSILLRERGVPAVTNVRGVTRALSTGDPVEIRAGAGVVERLLDDVQAGLA
jgi:pyruvate,water dikinase